MSDLRVIVIPAESDEPIRETLLNSEGTLAAMQNLVGGWIEMPTLLDQAPAPVTIQPVINEGGKLEGFDRNVRATRMMRSSLFLGDWIAGDMLLTGAELASGETVSLPEHCTLELVSQLTSEAQHA